MECIRRSEAVIASAITFLYIDHVQGDPFASPSRLHFEVKRDRHGFPEEYYQEKHRRLALEDQVLRRFLYELRQIDKDFMGSGKSGRITICPANQTVQERIAVAFSKEKMELRFEMGFPARGRTILSKEMQKLVFDILPQLAENALFYRNWDTKKSKNIWNRRFYLQMTRKPFGKNSKREILQHLLRTELFCQERAEFPTGQCVEQFHLLRRNL